MARISGINLPPGKRIMAALTLITGIGRNLSATILKETNISSATKVKDLDENEINRLRERISRLPTEGELRQRVSNDIKRLQEIGSYRGYRHRRKLPARGQTTRYNARTKRGKRVCVGSGRRKETKT